MATPEENKQLVADMYAAMNKNVLGLMEKYWMKDMVWEGPAGIGDVHRGTDHSDLFHLVERRIVGGVVHLNAAPPARSSPVPGAPRSAPSPAQTASSTIPPPAPPGAVSHSRKQAPGSTRLLGGHLGDGAFACRNRTGRLPLRDRSNDRRSGSSGSAAGNRASRDKSCACCNAYPNQRAAASRAWPTRR